MSGAVSLRGKFLWPPGPAKFVEKIRMDIDFGIDNGKFHSQETQGAINRISKSGQGESKKEAQDDPRTMLSNLRGHVAFRNGVARFSGVRSPSGRLGDPPRHLRAGKPSRRPAWRPDDNRQLSDTTSGFKALVLKAITPFFKKKHDLKVVPFKITGTFANASEISIDRRAGMRAAFWLLECHPLHPPVEDFADQQLVRIAAVDLVDRAELLRQVAGAAEFADTVPSSSIL